MLHCGGDERSRRPAVPAGTDRLLSVNGPPLLDRTTSSTNAGSLSNWPACRFKRLTALPASLPAVDQPWRAAVKG